MDGGMGEGDGGFYTELSKYSATDGERRLLRGKDGDEDCVPCNEVCEMHCG